MGSVLDCGAAATKPSQLRVSFRAKSECHGGVGAGASRGPSPLPCHRLSVPSARPRPTSAHSDTRYTVVRRSEVRRSLCALCSLGSRGQGGPGAQEAAWLCGDETGNELIRSCGALSKVPPHCDVSRVTSHVQVLGLQRSFSCGDIVSVPSWPPQLLHARSDSWLVSAECDYSWGGPGGGPLARLDANSRYENRAKIFTPCRKIFALFLGRCPRGWRWGTWTR